jgi:hypothetical protein
MPDDQKLSLQAFLQVLTSRSLPVSRAITVAGKMFRIRVCLVHNPLTRHLSHQLQGV